MAAAEASLAGDDGADERYFACKMDVVKTVADVLSAISDPKKSRDDTTVLVVMESDGMRFCVYDKSKSLQATATLRRTHFQEYELPGGDISCSISLTLLMECLTVFGATSLAGTSLHMSHRPADGTFNVVLVESGVITECEIQTLAGDEEIIDFVSAFGASSQVCRAIVASDFLRDAFSEVLDLPGVSVVQLSVSQAAPQLTIAAVGHVGSCDIELGTSTKAFVSFECGETRTFRYSVRLLQHALRALHVASRTCIRLNDEGMLGFQHKVTHTHGEHSFVDCILLPEEEEEEEHPAAPAAHASFPIDR